MSLFALINGRIIDPTSGYDGPGGVLVDEGKIVACGSKVGGENVPKESAVDVQGQVIAPGLIDTQVFIGEPGEEHRETMKTASRAAVAGGVTTIATQPNTVPVVDSPAMVKSIHDRANEAGIGVAPMAALTVGQNGEHLSNMGMLCEAGAVALTDTPHCVGNNRLMRQAILYAATFDALIVQQVQDRDLAQGGVMHEGAIATNLGLTGIPREAETIALARDLLLLAEVKGRYHAAALSCGSSVELLNRARESGSAVTAGVQIPHLLLTDADLGSYYTFRKLSPPLREESDRDNLRAAIASGDVDIIASGHNPHSADTKRQPFVDAAAGSVGLETMLPALLMLHLKSGIPLIRLLACATVAPARLLRLDRGTLCPGAPADIVVFDTHTRWRLDRRNLISRSNNTCFDKLEFTGRVTRTYVGGQLRFQAT